MNNERFGKGISREGVDAAFETQEVHKNLSE